MSINISLLGQRIRSARQEKRLDIFDLAQRIGITPESLGHIERGIRKPSLSTLIQIADTLGVSLDYLAGRLPDSFGRNALLSEAQTQILTEFIDAVIPVVKRVGKK